MDGPLGKRSHLPKQENYLRVYLFYSLGRPTLFNKQISQWNRENH